MSKEEIALQLTLARIQALQDHGAPSPDKSLEAVNEIARDTYTLYNEIYSNLIVNHND